MNPTYTYAGIGARSTPDNVLTTMTRVAENLELTGFTLRSGGAAGADSAFERGVANHMHKEIFLPWRGFNDNKSEYSGASAKAYEMAEKFHPAWDMCSQAARKFHARNCHQVLGWTLNKPSDFILCWTPGGVVTGGTGQALRIAQHYGIPIFNMYQDDWDRPFFSFMQYLLDQPAGWRFEEENENE